MSEGSIEHRTNFRPPTPIPGLSARLDRAMETLAKKQRWNLVAHGSMVGFTLLCVAVVWWSIAVRLPLLEQNSVELRQANQLRNQLEQLRLRENRAVEKGLLASMKAHEKELFSDNKEVVRWLRQQINRARQHGFALRYSLGGVRTALITHHAMAISLHLDVTHEPGSNGFARLVRFVEQMRHHGIALHIERVLLSGTGRGLAAMDLQVTIWMM